MAYTEEQLIGALRKADAAGDTAAAKAIAQRIKGMRTPAPDFKSSVTASVDSTAPDAATAAPDGWKYGAARDTAFGARSVLQGAGGLLGAVGGDAFNHYLVDPVRRALHTPTMSELITGEGVAPTPSYRDSAAALADRMNLPKAQTSGDRVLGDVGEGLTGTAATIGLGGLLNAGRQVASTVAPSVMQRLGGFLTAQPVLQGVSTATGTGAASATREAGGGQGAQLLAGLAGGLAPAATQATAAATTRGLLRGNNASQVQNNIGLFRTGGTTPSVGQATGNRRTQALETLLATVPGGAGPMAAKATAQASQVSSRLDDMAGMLTPRGASVTPTQAGSAISKGITGPDGFLAETKKVSGQLYDNLDAAIAPDTRVDVSNVTKALSELNAEIPGAPSVSKFFQNGRIQGIEGGLLNDTQGVDALLTQPGMQEKADAYRQYLQGRAQQAAARNEQRRIMQPGASNFEPVATPQQIDEDVRATLGNMVDSKLPYEALKKLRTLVGNELENYSIASDVPRSKWKSVYGALSKDLEAVAGQSPEAKRAWDRANTYYNARVKRIEAIDHVIDKSGGGEKIYNAAFSGIKDGATTLRAVMQSLPGDAQKEVASAFVRRMGKAVGSQQNDAGDAFSMGTFLTTWANTSPEARRVLFDRFGPNYSRDMDRIAKMANNVRDGSKVFANPSGTGRVNAMVGAIGTTGSTIGTLIATGHPGLAAGATAAAGGAYAGTNWLARKMTDPAFVGWLAMSTGLPLGAIPSQAAMLRQIGEKKKDPDYAAAADWLEQHGKDNGGK
jgi:hypothetical protein